MSQLSLIDLGTLKMSSLLYFLSPYSCIFKYKTFSDDVHSLNTKNGNFKINIYIKNIFVRFPRMKKNLHFMFLCTFDIFLYEELKYKIKHKIKFDKNYMLTMCHVLCCKTRIQKSIDSLLSVEQLRVKQGRNLSRDSSQSTLPALMEELRVVHSLHLFIDPFI